jgi:predicted PurR-regulated permease PerM
MARNSGLANTFPESDVSDPKSEKPLGAAPQALRNGGVAQTATPAEEEAEVLQASIKAGSVAQIVVAVIAVLGLIYLLKLVLVTTLVAMLLAFVLEPMVAGLRRFHLPRAAGALMAVLLTFVLFGSLTYFFYSRAVDFATTLPAYSGKLRQVLSRVRTQTGKIEESTRSVMGSTEDGKYPVPVEIREPPDVTRVVAAGSGAVGEIVLAISFLPFLVFFMLTWKDHAHLATVRLFPKEHRMTAHRTVGRISTMIRSFIAGNLLLGLINAVVSTLVFWRFGIPYFYFVGVISGFISLIPYLGVFLALLTPLAGGIGVLDKTGAVLIIITVIGLHLLAMNFLYPKIVGKRLRLNPLAVTLSLLFWAWIWGAMGLVLAVPIVGATKIICDYMEPLRGFGAWLGE